MTHRKNRISILFAIAVLIISLALPAAAGAQTEPTTLYVNPATASATTCPASPITVAISVGNVEELTAFHLEISFDPEVIQVDEIEPAEFIIGEGESYLPEPSNEIDNVNGFISWGLAKQGSGGDPNPVNGTGDLILITLHAIVPNQSSPIDIDEENSILVNWPDAFEIPFTAMDGVVNTSSCPPTDIALSNNTIQENMPVGTTIGTFSSTDPDGDTTFTYTLVDPTGYPDNTSFTITGSTLESTVSFNYETKSSYHIRVRSTDPWGAYYEEVFSILIIDVNDTPVLVPIGNQTANEGVLLTFTATATDEDTGQPLTFSLSGAPTGASIDPSTGVFTWTPSESDGGQTFTFTVCVSDGVFSDCETITVTVNEVNSAPILGPIGNKTVNELETLSFTAEASDSDIPVQILTFSLVDAPLGATIDPATGAFSWTPAEAQGPGTYSFTVKVCDNGTPSACDQETITVTVNEVNVAPVLAPIGDKTTNELVALTFTASATDADIPANTLTFSLANGTSGEVPAGASIDASTGAFSWTPTEAQGPGSYTFDVCVSDGTLSDCETITVTVNEVNVAPVLGTIGDQTIDELATLTFTAKATDSDIPANTLTFSLANGTSGEVPAGASIDASTGAFNWTPTEAQGPGSYTFDVCVSDGTLSDCETITVTVNEVNVAPVLGTIGDQTIDELATLTFTARATDSDIPANTLTFSLANGTSGHVPAGANIDASTGEFSWTPTEAQGSATYTFDVCVSDGALSDCETITVTVNEVNVAPVLGTIGNQTIDELATLTFTAAATDSDIPVQTLAFSLVGAPIDATIDPATGAFSWTPTEAQGPATYTFDVCVSDGALTDCETITVTVNEVNTAPVLGSIGNKNVNELTELTFIATAADNDIPAQTLTFSLVGGPTGAAINATTGAFSWTPSEVQGPGSYTFTVKVCDNGTPSLCDQEEITVTVSEVNTAPVAVDDNYITPMNRVLNVLAPGVLTNDSDADLPANTLTVVLVTDIPAGEGTLVLASNGAFSYTPPLDFLGTTHFTYKVFDSTVYSNEASVSITVTDANLPPTDITMTDQTILENQPIGTVVSYLSSVDPNLGDTFTYSLVSGDGSGDNDYFSIDGNRLLSAEVFDYETKDSYTIRIRTTDQGGLWFEKSFTITILDANDAPVANDQSVTTPEDTALAITLTGSDQDGDLLSFAVIAQPMHGILTGTAPFLTYTPAANYNGSDSFTFNADDGELVSNVATVSITVSPVNDDPILSPIGNKSVNELVLLTFTASASDLDLPPQTLTFSLVGAPTGAAIDAASGVFTWTPTEAQGPGEYTFDVCVSDGVATVCETISVTVNEVNIAPVLAEIGDQEVDELDTLEFVATATDADIPVQTLVFSLAGEVPEGAVITTAGAFSWTPSEAQGPGEYTFDVCVSDSILSDCETITVTVNEVNVAPVANDMTETTTEDTAKAITLNVSDIDGDTLTAEILSNPTQGQVSVSGIVVTYTPNENYNGSDSFTYRVSDGELWSDSATVNITITPVNDAPVAVSFEVELQENSSVTFDLLAYDVEDDPLTYNLVSGPAHGTVNCAGAICTYTPNARWSGTDSFIFTANDGLLDSNEAAVTLNVIPLPRIYLPIIFR